MHNDVVEWDHTDGYVDRKRGYTYPAQQIGLDWGLCLDDDSMVLIDILPDTAAARSEAIRDCIRA